MEISEDFISFKSAPDFYLKERSGAKSNTIRKLNEIEIRMLNLWIESRKEHGLPLTIQINLRDSKKAFRRRISDISEYQGYYVFSWR